MHSNTKPGHYPHQSTPLILKRKPEIKELSCKCTCTLTEPLVCFSSSFPSPSSFRILIACNAPSLFPRCLNFLSFKSAERSSWFPGRVKQKASLDLPPHGIGPFNSSLGPGVQDTHAIIQCGNCIVMCVAQLEKEVTLNNQL